jgi:hypothetical protein
MRRMEMTGGGEGKKQERQKRRGRVVRWWWSVHDRDREFKRPKGKRDEEGFPERPGPIRGGQASCFRIPSRTWDKHPLAFTFGEGL